MYEYAQQHFEQKTFAEVIEPAAKLAENGFPCTASFEKRLAAQRDDIRKFPGTAAVLLKRNRSVCAGDLIVQPDLAKTYRAIGREGSDYFYKGDFTHRRCLDERERRCHYAGGLCQITECDSVSRSSALIAVSRLSGFPPPSSGGVHVGADSQCAGELRRRCGVRRRAR